MRLSMSAVLVILIGFSISALQSSVWAQAPTSPTPGSKTGASTLQQTTGQLKTDTSKTKQDVKDLDVKKSKQDVGDVKKDVKNVGESAKDLVTNPLGK